MRVNVFKKNLVSFITLLGFSNIIIFRYCLFQQSITHNWFMLQKCDLSYLNCVSFQNYHFLQTVEKISKIDNNRSKDAMLLVCFVAMFFRYP